MARGWMNAKRELAASLLAVGEKTKEEIADAVGINRVTLHRWEQVKEFEDRVAFLRSKVRDEIRARTLSFGIADKVERINAAQRRWELMQSIVIKQLERKLEIISGIDSETPKIMRDVEDGDADADDGDADADEGGTVVSGGLLRELRMIEKQIAIETGEWDEPGASGSEKTYINVDIDRI